MAPPTSRWCRSVPRCMDVLALWKSPKTLHKCQVTSDNRHVFNNRNVFVNRNVFDCRNVFDNRNVFNVRNVFDNRLHHLSIILDMV